MIIQKIKDIIPNNTKRILKERVSSLMALRSVEVLAEEYCERHIIAGKPLILYIANRYDYGDPTRGLGYEHQHFYQTFLRCGYSFIYFDYDRIAQRVGIKKMSKMLRELTYQYQPEVLFYFHHRDLINHSYWKEVSRELPIKTAIFLADDYWRHELTRPIWSIFNIVITLDKFAEGKRRKEGFSGVVRSQWAVNHFTYRDLGLTRRYDVSFIGQVYGDRPKIIKKLRDAGVDVHAFGRGWPRGKRIYQSDLIRIYNQSKIVFNISYSSRGNLAVNARDFEGPACGALLFTHDTEDIREYFIPGKEIITYRDFDDAIEKLKYYLSHDDEREKIACAGHERVLRDHTYEKRFHQIFSFIKDIKK